MRPVDLQAPAGSSDTAAGSEQTAPPVDLPGQKIATSAGGETFTLPEVIERHREVTDKISTQVRTISIGMLVFVWSMLNAAPGTPIANAAKGLMGGIGMVAMFAVLALLADYLQYVLGNRVVAITRANKEYQKTQVYKWPTELIVFQAQYWCFWGKQVLCMFGVLLVVVLVFAGFFS